MEIVELAPDDARLDDVYPVLHELRTALEPGEFHERYEEGYPDGYRVVALFDDGACRAVAGYRIMTNFIHGKICYIDDLVTTASGRSKGYGKALNAYVVDIARREGCSRVTLDSHVHRTGAHRFYLRERYDITSFHFGRAVDAGGDAGD